MNSRTYAVAASVVVSLLLAPAALAGKLGDRTDGEEEEINARIQWFYGNRGLLDGSVDVETARSARLKAALDVRARIEAGAGMRAPNALWTSIGPAPMTMLGWAMGTVSGRVTTIAVDPTAPATLFVGGAAGGFWRSTDGGTTWTNVFETLPTQTIGSSAIAPSDHLQVWVGTGDYNSGCGGYFGAGVFRSTDGGVTFVERNGTPQTLFLGITSGISVHPTNPMEVVVGGNDECAGGSGQGGIYRTTDGGATWTKTYTGTMHELVRDPSDPLVLYAAQTTTAVVKSTNGGQSWAAANTGITLSGGRWEIAIAPSSPQTLYALHSGSEDLYATTNGGASWALRNSNACDGQCWYNLTMKVAANDPNVLYRGTILPYKSTNGGTNFQALTSGWGGSQTVHQDIQHIERHPTDPNTIFIGSDGGIWKTTNGGASFSNLNGNLNMTQFYDVAIHPTDNAIALGGSQDNSSEAYRGSAVWDVEQVTGDGFVNLINPVNPSYCYVSSYYGNIYRSQNGIGGPFAPISGDITDSCGWLTPYLFDPANPDILYAGCVRVWRSTDRGTNWVPASTTLNGNTLGALAIAPSNGQVIYAGNGGGLWRTTDGGGSWIDVSGNLPSRNVSDIAVDAADPMHVYATQTRFGQQFWYSTTGGTAWTEASNGVPAVPVNTVLLLESPPRIYIGTDVGVLVSTSGDAGPYVPDMSGFPQGVPVTDLEYNATTDTITAGTYGRGAYQRDASAVEFQPDSVLVGKGAGSGSAYDARIHAYRVDGTQIAQIDILGFTATGFGANVAGGDVDGDSFGDVATAQGPGSTHPPVAKLFDRASAGLPGGSVTPYGGTGYGANVGSSDVENDGRAELLTGPGEGEVYGPQVRAFNYDAGAVTAIAKINYYAYATLKYGVNVAGLAYDGDLYGEILSGAGPGAVFGPHVRGWQFDGAALTADGKVNFFAYSTLKYGVNVSGADVELDGHGELLTAAGPGQVFGPAVRGFNADGGAVSAMSKINFFAYATGKYGANVAGGDFDADGYGEIATAPGPDASRAAELAGFDYDGNALAAIPAMSRTVWTGVQYGLTVGASKLGY